MDVDVKSRRGWAGAQAVTLSRDPKKNGRKAQVVGGQEQRCRARASKHSGQVTGGGPKPVSCRASEPREGVLIVLSMPREQSEP